MCCTKWSSVINSIYSGQQLFSYNTIDKNIFISQVLLNLLITIGTKLSCLRLVNKSSRVWNLRARQGLYFYLHIFKSYNLFLHQRLFDLKNVLWRYGAIWKGAQFKHENKVRAFLFLWKNVSKHTSLALEQVLSSSDLN